MRICECGHNLSSHYVSGLVCAKCSCRMFEQTEEMVNCKKCGHDQMDHNQYGVCLNDLCNCVEGNLEWNCDPSKVLKTSSLSERITESK